MHDRAKRVAKEAGHATGKTSYSIPFRIAFQEWTLMLDQYDGFTTLYAKLTLTVSGITLEVRPTGSGEDLVFETASTIF